MTKKTKIPATVDDIERQISRVSIRSHLSPGDIERQTSRYMQPLVQKVYYNELVDDLIDSIDEINGIISLEIDPLNDNFVSNDGSNNTTVLVGRSIHSLLRRFPHGQICFGSGSWYIEDENFFTSLGGDFVFAINPRHRSQNRRFNGYSIAVFIYWDDVESVLIAKRGFDKIQFTISDFMERDECNRALAVASQFPFDIDVITDGDSIGIDGARETLYIGTVHGFRKTVELNVEHIRDINIIIPESILEANLYVEDDHEERIEVHIQLLNHNTRVHTNNPSIIVVISYL
jgi:hypothetical protein